MSVINQMLRDLDARGAVPTDSDAVREPLAVSAPPSAARRTTVFLLLLASGVAVSYFGLSGPSGTEGHAVSAGAARHRIDAAPAVAVDTSSPSLGQHVALAPTMDKQVVANKLPMGGSTIQHAAQPKPEAIRAEQVVPAVPVIRRSASSHENSRIAVAQTVVHQVPAATVAAQAEPTVVKKPVEPSPEAAAQRLYDDAQAMRRAGKTDAAITQYRLALERYPAMRNARIQLAKTLQENGQPEAALSLLKAGYEQQQDEGLAIAAGRLLAELGRQEEALVWLERGSGALRPADHALMGALLSQTQRYEEAVKAYRRALSMDPDQGGWQLGLGLALESLGRPAEAQQAYRNALEFGTFKPEVIRFLRQKTRMSAP